MKRGQQWLNQVSRKFGGRSVCNGVVLPAGGFNKMNFAHGVLNSIASYCYKERCEVVFFDPSTSIGMASEMLRLWLLFAGSTGRKIIIAPGYRILGAKRNSQRVFCREIYFLSSPFIVKLPFFLSFILRIFATVCYVIIWVMRRVSSQCSNSWHKSIFNSYDVYCSNIFSREDVQLFNPQLILGLDLSSEQMNRVRRKINAGGFELPDRYVCVHVRTGVYYAESGYNVRNASIDSYYRLITNLLERGFYVILMGDKIKLPQRFVELSGFFDYPSSSLKSELLDLWLIRNCTFYIGTVSGIQDTAFLFKKDVILTNFIPLPFRYSGARFVCLMKKVLSDSYSMMSLRDICECLPDFFDHGEGAKFCENTESELVAALDVYFSYDTVSDDSFRFYNARALEFYRLRVYGSIWYENIEKSEGVLIFNSGPHPA